MGAILRAQPDMGVTTSAGSAGYVEFTPPAGVTVPDPPASGKASTGGPALQSTLSVATGETNVAVTPGPAWLWVTVRDRSGSPVKGAQVSYARMDAAGAAHGKQRFKDLTDERGFAQEAVVEGQLTVSVADIVVSRRGDTAPVGLELRDASLKGSSRVITVRSRSDGSTPGGPPAASGVTLTTLFMEGVYETRHRYPWQNPHVRISCYPGPIVARAQNLAQIAMYLNGCLPKGTAKEDLTDGRSDDLIEKRKERLRAQNAQVDKEEAEITATPVPTDKKAKEARTKQLTGLQNLRTKNEAEIDALTARDATPPTSTKKGAKGTPANVPSVTPAVLAEAGEPALLGKLLAIFAKGGTTLFPNWLRYMVLHITGIRYNKDSQGDSAHNTYTLPQRLVCVVRCAEINAAKSPEFTGLSRLEMARVAQEYAGLLPAPVPPAKPSGKAKPHETTTRFAKRYSETRHPKGAPGSDVIIGYLRKPDSYAGKDFVADVLRPAAIALAGVFAGIDGQALADARVIDTRLNDKEAALLLVRQMLTRGPLGADFWKYVVSQTLLRNDVNTDDWEAGPPPATIKEFLDAARYVNKKGDLIAYETTTGWDWRIRGLADLALAPRHLVCDQVTLYACFARGITPWINAFVTAADASVSGGTLAGDEPPPTEAPSATAAVAPGATLPLDVTDPHLFSVFDVAAVVSAVSLGLGKALAAGSSSGIITAPLVPLGASSAAPTAPASAPAGAATAAVKAAPASPTTSAPAAAASSTIAAPVASTSSRHPDPTRALYMVDAANRGALGPGRDPLRHGTIVFFYEFRSIKDSADSGETLRIVLTNHMDKTEDPDDLVPGYTSGDLKIVTEAEVDRGVSSEHWPEAGPGEYIPDRYAFLPLSGTKAPSSSYPKGKGPPGCQIVRKRSLYLPPPPPPKPTPAKPAAHPNAAAPAATPAPEPTPAPTPPPLVLAKYTERLVWKHIATIAVTPPAGAVTYLTYESGSTKDGTGARMLNRKLADQPGEVRFGQNAEGTQHPALLSYITDAVKEPVPDP